MPRPFPVRPAGEKTGRHGARLVQVKVNPDAESGGPCYEGIQVGNSFSVPARKNAFAGPWHERVKNSLQPDGVYAVAGQGERIAKNLAPVDTGNLRSSIKRDKVDDKRAAVDANNDGSAPYAAFVEYGTSRMGAQPFMRPMATRLQREGGRIAAKILKEALRRG